MSDRFKQLSKTYSNSVLVNTLMGNLLRLYTPVTARVRKPIAHLQVNELVPVTAILESEDHKLLFMVGEYMYPHTYFELLNEERKTT
jgi:hypothetical protein